jgi:hypothetical protein
MSMKLITVFLAAFTISLAAGCCAFAATAVLSGGSVVVSVAAAAFWPWMATTLVVLFPLSVGLTRVPHWPLWVVAVIGFAPAVVAVVLFNAQWTGRFQLPSFHGIDAMLLVLFGVAGAVFLCVARTLAD